MLQIQIKASDCWYKNAVKNLDYLKITISTLKMIIDRQKENS